MHANEIFKSGLACAAFSLLLNGAVLAQGRTASPAAGTAITPTDAQRAIDILQDDARRAELIRTLHAIAAAAPATPAAGTAPPGPAPAQQPGPSTANAAPDTIVPLEAGGLMARTLRSFDRWTDNFLGQLTEARQAARQAPALLTQSRALMTESGRRMLALLGLALAAAFAIGLLLEWSLRLALRRPRDSLAQHADQLAMQHARRHAWRHAWRHEAPHAGSETAGATGPSFAGDRTAGAAPPPDAVPDPAGIGAQAGLRPRGEGLAIVQTHRDGVDRIEAIPVGTDNAAGAPARRQAAAPPPDAGDADRQWRRSSHLHWSTLRNLPSAIGALILEILPIALFFVAANVTLRILTGGHPRVAEAVGSFIQAYVTLRLTMALVRLLVSPAGQGLRLLEVGPATAALIVAWIRRLAVLALFGMAVADTIPLLGAAGSLRPAFLKAVSLLVHLGAVVFILRLRRPVRRVLRAPPDSPGALAVARNWLADAWAVIAIVMVMGVWVVWAMGVTDGFSKVIHFVLVSTVVLVAGRLLAILILGALGRMFSSGKETANGDGASARAANGRGRWPDRYYPWLRGLVSIAITVVTIVALFEAWGFHSLDWFAPATLGRSLASAALTIVIAIIIAILIWEAAQYSVDRRLERWTALGDTVRAARLRTLLPMLRTALFIVVVLIVGLTALNELGVNTTPLLAGASIVGVAVGFGSQKLVQDFITGIFLLMENAMRVGDWVTVAGVSGSVEYLSIRTVRLRGGDGALYIVPFSSVSTVSNSNRGIGNAAVRISVAYDSDIDMVMRELKEIGASLRADPVFKEQILNDLDVWGVDSVDGSMVTVVGQMRCTDKGRWGVQREINRRILERFRERGIAIANPRASLLMPLDASLPASPAVNKS
jgi:small-conductance mechanosensitive channel